VIPLPRPGRCVVMGVLNVTPDSFSDGGCFSDPATAIEHGLAMHAAGSDYVDVGGESTRPGADRVDAREECARVVPVIRELSAAGVRTSVDTTRAEVAEAALAAGAELVNDVSGGLADKNMADLVAEAGVPWVLMHWRGHSREMYAAAQYGDVVTEVCAELTARVEDVVAAGVAPEQLVLDPGLGFAKRAEHNWALLAGLDRLTALGLPVLAGCSPALTPLPGRPRSGTPPRWPRRCSRPRPARGASGCTTRPPRWTRCARWPRCGPPGGADVADRRPDRIALRGVRAHAHHGVYAFERERGQIFTVDAVLELDTAPAAAGDDLALTVNYADLAQRLHGVLTGEPVDLLETLCQRLADVCLADPLVEAVEITVHKPQAELGVPFDDVTVSIRRERA
jgi:dihydropteroate synthase